MGYRAFLIILAVGFAGFARGEAPADNGGHSVVSRVLLDFEIGRLRVRGDEDAKSLKLRHVGPITSDPAIRAALQKWGLDPAQPPSLNALSAVQPENEEDAARLISLLRFENAKREKPATDDATLTGAMLQRELALLGEMPTTEIALGKELRDKFAASYALLHPEPGAALLPGANLTASQIRDVIANAPGFKPTLVESATLAGLLRLNAFSTLGNRFLEGVKPDHSDGLYEDVPNSVREHFNKQYVEPASPPLLERGNVLPEQRQRPGMAMPDNHGGGQASFSGRIPAEVMSRLGRPAEFSRDELGELNKVKNTQGRVSVGMKIGKLVKNPTDPDGVLFVAQSICQATPVAKAVLEGNSCRFVVASARHCFGKYNRDRDTMELDGFGVIPPSHREVFVSSAASKEDFATLLIDAPCNTPVKIAKLAPKNYRLPDDATLVADTHRKKTGVIFGRTFDTNDKAFFGINAIGSSGIFPGDSGGGVSSSDGFYVGAMSSKFTDRFFRDGAGFVARTPAWAEDGAAGEFLTKPLADYKVALQRHRTYDAGPDIAIHAPSGAGAFEVN